VFSKSGGEPVVAVGEVLVFELAVASKAVSFSFSILLATMGRRLVRLVKMLNQKGAPKLSSAALIRMPRQCWDNPVR